MKEVIPIRSLKASHPEQDLSENFRIRDIKTILQGRDMTQQTHRHYFFFILVLKKGGGNHKIDFQPYRVHSQSVFIMRPGQVHQLELNRKCDGYLVEFLPGFFSETNKSTDRLLRRVSRTNHCHPEIKSFKKLSAILDQINQEFSMKQEGYYEAIQANLSLFFIELMRNRQNKLHISNSYEQDRLEQFQELLEKYFTTHKQVSQYANLLNLSPYQLNAITKRTTGKTCSEVIDDYIVLEAKRHLLSTHKQVNQIAYYLGFDDVSYFIRFFKKHSGHSPEAFRLKFR